MSIFEIEEIVHTIYGQLDHYTLLLTLSEVNRTCYRVFKQPSRETCLLSYRKVKNTTGDFQMYVLRGSKILHGPYKIRKERSVKSGFYLLGKLHGYCSKYSRKANIEYSGSFFDHEVMVIDQRWIHDRQNKNYFYFGSHYPPYGLGCIRRRLVDQPFTGPIVPSLLEIFEEKIMISAYPSNVGGLTLLKITMAYHQGAPSLISTKMFGVINRGGSLEFASNFNEYAKVTYRKGYPKIK